MAKCEICGKGPNYARKHKYRGSHLTARPKRRQKPNLQTVRMEENGVIRKVKVCTRCLRAGRLRRAER